MIQLIVNLYRVAIGALFLVGAFLSISMMASGNAGFILGLSTLVAVIMLVGISAVLISINDRLAGLANRQPTDGPAPASPLTGKQALLAVFVILVLLVVSGIMAGPNNSQPALPGQVEAPRHLPSSSIKEGCVPELASQVGLNCSE